MSRAAPPVAPLDPIEVRARPATTQSVPGRATGPLPELLSELLHTTRQVNSAAAGDSPGASPSRRKRDASVGQPPRWAPNVSADPDAVRRMNELRDMVVRQLSQLQGVPDPTSMHDVSPYSHAVFSTPNLSSPRRDDGRVRPPNSLPVGERVKASKTFGKRVFDGGIPVPLPPSSPSHSHARFGKRMNIELESKRRALVNLSAHVRKPDKESIFSERFQLLRRGILNVDEHKPCIRLPSAGRDQSRDCIPGLSSPRGGRVGAASPRSTTAQDAMRESGTGPRPAPPTRSYGHAHEQPASARDTRYMATATGAVIQRDPRPLLVDATKYGRPQPQTIRTIAADD